MFISGARNVVIGGNETRISTYWACLVDFLNYIHRSGKLAYIIDECN